MSVILRLGIGAAAGQLPRRFVDLFGSALVSARFDEAVPGLGQLSGGFQLQPLGIGLIFRFQLQLLLQLFIGGFGALAAVAEGTQRLEKLLGLGVFTVGIQLLGAQVVAAHHLRGAGAQVGLALFIIAKFLEQRLGLGVLLFAVEGDRFFVGRGFPLTAAVPGLGPAVGKILQSGEGFISPGVIARLV